MKKIMALAASFIILAMAHAQDDYKTTMKENIQALDTVTDAATLSRLAATFSAIYDVKKDWLPLYYQCLAYIKLSGAYNNAGQKKEAISMAAVLLDSLAADNDEVLVLRALYAMNYLAIDRSAWQTYLPVINNSIAKAQAINPANPRSYYLQGIIKYNMPASMGGGHDEGIKLFKLALQKFDAFAPASYLAPVWGRRDTEKYLSN
jgi:hypothetical protein